MEVIANLKKVSVQQFQFCKGNINPISMCKPGRHFNFRGSFNPSTLSLNKIQMRQ